MPPAAHHQDRDIRGASEYPRYEYPGLVLFHCFITPPQRASPMSSPLTIALLGNGGIKFRCTRSSAIFRLAKLFWARDQPFGADTKKPPP